MGDNLSSVPFCTKAESLIGQQESLVLRRLHLSRAKLRASSRVSALLAGFAMVAIVELEICVPRANVPEGLIVAFTALACLLVAVHMIAVMISTCILPHLDAYVNLPENIAAMETPHNRLKIFIDVAWVFSTVVGILLFLAFVVLACWVKFWDLSRTSAIVSTVVLVPALLVFASFAILFYYALVGHKVQRANELIKTLDMHMHLLESGELKIKETDLKEK